MSIAPENITHENISDILEMPTVEQMVELNAVSIRTVLGHGKLRKSAQHKSAHIFLADELHTIEEPDEIGMRYSTQRFVGRIAKVGFHRWSMRIAESYWVRGIDGEDDTVGENQDGYRASYMFEWSKAGVMYAKKHLHVFRKDPVAIIKSRIEGEPSFSLDGLVEEVSQADLLRRKGLVHPQVFFVLKEMERVSRADCDSLIQDITSFGEASTSEEVL